MQIGVLVWTQLSCERHELSVSGTTGLIPLSLADHVRDLDPTERCACWMKGLEAHHRPGQLLDKPVILRDDVVRIPEPLQGIEARIEDSVTGRRAYYSMTITFLGLPSPWSEPSQCYVPRALLPTAISVNRLSRTFSKIRSVGESKRLSGRTTMMSTG